MTNQATFPRLLIFMSFLIALLFYLTAGAVEAGEGQAPEVETIEVDQPGVADKAAELWDKTKEVTGETVNSAVTYSKEKGGQAWEAGKEGVAKGTEVVVDQSKKAWGTTKETGAKVVDYSGEKAAQFGNVVKQAIGGTSDQTDGEAPVTDKSPGQ